MESAFKASLSSLLGEQHQRALKALWHVDNIGHLKAAPAKYTFMQDFIRYRSLLGHLDHLVLRKFLSQRAYVQAAALLNQGGCRTE